MQILRPDRAVLAFAALLGLTFALALLTGRPAAAQDAGAPAGAVERVRVVPLGDGSFYEIHVLVDTTDGTNADTVVDGFAPGGSAGGVSAQYVPWGPKWAASDIPVSVRYNGAAEPAGLNVPTYLQAAMATWSSVTAQSFRFSWAGLATGGYDTCGSTPADGVNTVLFGTFSDSHILAATCVSYRVATDGPHRAEFDMLINKSTTWSVGDATPANAFDLPSTVLHELGHALGLDHTTTTGAVMVATLAPGKRVRSLAADDVAGIRALYGTGPPPESDPAPTLKPLNHSLRFASMARDN